MKLIAAAALLFCGAAHAAVIAVAQQGKHRLELHDEAGPCLGSARLAIYTDGAQRIPGCWLVRPDAVTVSFLDGDHAAIPMAAFKPPQDV